MSPARIAADLHHACDLVFCDEAPSLVGLLPHPDGLELTRHRPLGHYEELVGWRAPDGWTGLALVGTGRAARMDRRTDQVERVRFTVAADRAGRVASTLTTPTTAYRSERLTALPGATAELQGPVLDVCLRVLGLPTPPSADTPLQFIHRHWLLAIVERASERGRLTWRDLQRLHALSPLRRVTPFELGRATALALEGYPWERLLHAVRNGAEGLQRFTPAQLAWFDGPSFGRAMVVDLPPFEALVETVDELLGPRLAGDVRRALHAAGDIPPGSVAAVGQPPRSGAA